MASAGATIFQNILRPKEVLSESNSPLIFVHHFTATS
jgi:hypothetical protein